MAMLNRVFFLSSICAVTEAAALLRGDTHHNHHAILSPTPRGLLQVEAPVLSPPESQRPYRQELHNFGDVQYTADISVGGQTMRGVLDTGSFDLFVFSKDCPKCGMTRELYDRNRSEAYQGGLAVAEHTFGSGVTFSYEAFDSIALGLGATGPALAASRQRFWEVFDAAMPVIQGSAFQAVVGVGPPDSVGKLVNEKSGHQLVKMEQEVKKLGLTVPKRFQDLEQLEQVDDTTSTAAPSLCANLGVRSFSICIGQEAGQPGYFVWNDDTPQSSPEVFTEIPVEGSVHWGVNMTNVVIGGNMGPDEAIDIGCADGCGAVVDSGTSLIAAPSNVIRKLGLALRHLKEDCSNLDDMPDLKFTLGGQDFSLPPDAYMGQVSSRSLPGLDDILHFNFWPETYRCVPLFMAIDSRTQFGNLWILGLPFFRKYYTNFEYDYSTEPVGKSLSVALADSQCEPVDGKSLLGVHRMSRAKRIDFSSLQVPHWARQAAGNQHYVL